MCKSVHAHVREGGGEMWRGDDMDIFLPNFALSSGRKITFSITREARTRKEQIIK